MRRVAAPTIGLSLVIIASVLAVDFVVNTKLMPGLTPYTPLATLIIAVLIAPPYVLVLQLKTERVRETERLLAREQSARTAAEAVQEVRNRFFANTSHELRTPLHGIINYSELMLETALEDQRHQDVDDLQKVLSASHRLLALLNDLLDLAKIEAGKLTLDRRAYLIAPMIHEAVDLVRPAAERNRSRITVSIDDSLTRGFSDPFRIGQCLLNFLSNASKFTSEGVIEVDARRDTRTDGDWLVISVRDTGIGIAPEQQAVLFEPFMQASATDMRAKGGTGLGLAITRQIAQLLGGSVSMQSAPGEGSTFTLRVPLGEAPVEAPQAPRRELPEAVSVWAGVH